MSSMVVPRSVQDLMAAERNLNQVTPFYQQHVQQQAYDLRLLHDMGVSGGMSQAAAASHFMSAMAAGQPPYLSRDADENNFRLTLPPEAGDRSSEMIWAPGGRKKRPELGASEESADPPKRRHTAPTYSHLDDVMSGAMLDRAMMYEKDLMALAAAGRPSPHFMSGLPVPPFVPPAACHTSGGGLTSAPWLSHPAALFDLNRSMLTMDGVGRYPAPKDCHDLSSTAYSQRTSPPDHPHYGQHHSGDSSKFDYHPFGVSALGRGEARYSVPPSSRSADLAESCSGSRGGSPEPPDDDLAGEAGEGGPGSASGASQLCAVCGDLAAGFHCGAYVCEACKKFFVRCLKQEKGVKFSCSKNRECIITKDTRTQCQFCRFSKCLALGMYRPGGANISSEISNIPCKVCGSPSSGYHFGAITCEGCKGFFRRTIKERDHMKYQCSREGKCVIAANTRNICKFCRYHKCLQVGMKPDGSRIGRKPNSVKHATMLELHRIINSRGQENVPYSLPMGSQPATVKMEMSSPPSMSETSPSPFFRPMELYSRPCDAGMLGSSPYESESGRLGAVSEGVIDMSPRVFDDMHMDGLNMDRGDYMSHKSSPSCNVYMTPAAHSSSMGCRPSPDAGTPLSHHPPPPLSPAQPRPPCVYQDQPQVSSQHTKLLAIIDVMRKAAVDLQPILVKSEALVGLINPKMDTAGVWDVMMKQFEHCTMPVLSFAKKLGGFRALPMKTQVNMIQASMFPIVFLNLSSSYDLERETYNYFCMTPEEENIIMCHFPPFENLIGPFHTVGQIVKSLAMDAVEVAFLCAILLTNTNNCENYADDVIEALQLYCETERANHGGICRLGAIMLRLGELARATEAHQRCVVMIANDPGHYGNLPFPQLFQEVHLNHLMETGDIKPVSPAAVTQPAST